MIHITLLILLLNTINVNLFLKLLPYLFLHINQ